MAYEMGSSLDVGFEKRRVALLKQVAHIGN